MRTLIAHRLEMNRVIGLTADNGPAELAGPKAKVHVFVAERECLIKTTERVR